MDILSLSPSSDEQLSGGCCGCPQLWSVGIAACRRRHHGHPAGIPLDQLARPDHRHVQLGGRRQRGLCAGHQSAAVRLPHRRQPRPVELQPGKCDTNIAVPLPGPPRPQDPCTGPPKRSWGLAGRRN